MHISDYKYINISQHLRANNSNNVYSLKNYKLCLIQYYMENYVDKICDAIYLCLIYVSIQNILLILIRHTYMQIVNIRNNKICLTASDISSNVNFVKYEKFHFGYFSVYIQILESNLQE